jgi:hypothetical protein
MEYWIAKAAVTWSRLSVPLARPDADFGNISLRMA